ncbi:integral membrane PTH11-like protein [Aspergillus indologenus CBS 114.80]|uniref:Integral membrane PTH11-like protein n=1 Tax=Aspergillus indologenus CBS 114.80 TaxID=1450541 RepID=A0A2V5HZ85_9EURO|nr:integral membrane PTH11-like protein [Aspergillus indologenus CBS 114.80]
MASSEKSASREALVIVGYVVPMAGMLLTTGMRLLVKTRGQDDNFHMDDYLIMLATTLEVAYSVTMMASLGLGHGFGKHTSTVSVKDLEIFLKGEYVASHLYNVGLASTKLGILALYYRIFPVQWLSRTVIGCAIFICLWITTIEIFMGVLCRPLAAFWNPSVKGHCFNSSALSYYINCSNMVTDIFIFALPIPVILRLRTTLTKKIALCIIFSIGLITCAISAARLAYVFAQNSNDITWEGVPLAVLSAFESFGGILCANLPIIYRLFRSAAQKITSRTGNSSSAPKTPHRQYGYGSNMYGSKSVGRRARGVSAADDEQWIRLPNGNLSHGTTHETGNTIVTQVHEGSHTEESEEDTIELVVMPKNAITVQREFHQSVEDSNSS